MLVSRLAFEWDPRKAAANRRKHGVSFEEATTVFDDPAALLLADLEHGEPRIVAIGTSSRQRVLFVVSVEIDEDVTHRECSKGDRVGKEKL